MTKERKAELEEVTRDHAAECTCSECLELAGGTPKEVLGAVRRAAGKVRKRAAKKTK